MTLRLLAVPISLLGVSTAFAQAPGDYAPPPPPGAYPVVVVPARPSVMAHRWSVGLSIGGAAVGPSDSEDDDDIAGFRIGEIALRFRATPRLELELAASGGRQVVDDEDGDLAMGTVSLALRYHLMPERPWNVYFMGGFGGTVIAAHRSSDEEREGAVRPLGMLGVGLERRFRQIGIHAELRAIGMGPRDDDEFDDAPPPGRPRPVDLTEAVTYSDELSGASFTVGASLYF